LHSPARLHNYVKGLEPQEKVRNDKRWSEISFNVMWLVLDWKLWSCSHVQLKCVIRRCPLSSDLRHYIADALDAMQHNEQLCPSKNQLNLLNVWYIIGCYFTTCIGKWKCATLRESTQEASEVTRRTLSHVVRPSFQMRNLSSST
jgi:hypothetical protein